MTEQLATIPGDDWSDRLRQSMRKDRRRFYRGFYLLAALVLAGIGALVWWVYPPVHVPVGIVALDSIGLQGADAQLRAQVEAVEGEPVPIFLGQKQVVFTESRSLNHPNDQWQTIQATTAPYGRAEAATKAFVLGPATKVKYRVRLVGDRAGPVREDTAHAYIVPAGTMLVLVDVAQLLAAPAGDVWLGELANIAHDPAAAGTMRTLKDRNLQPVYLALDSGRAMEYRLQRRWVDSKSAVFPVGPVLGRPSFHDGMTAEAARRQIVEELATRFKLSAITAEHATARQFRDLKVKTIYLGADDCPKGVQRAGTWKDVAQVMAIAGGHLP